MKDAINLALKINQRLMKIYSVGGTQSDMYVTKSNYSRNTALPEEVVASGREYIVSMDELLKTAYTSIKRGYKLEDSQLGIFTVTEVNEMVVLGEIVGFRVRVE